MNEERGHKLLIYIFRRGIGRRPGGPFAGDDDRTKQPTAGLCRLKDMGVIPPHPGARLARSRATVGISTPGVVKAFARGHFASSPGRLFRIHPKVMSPLIVLVVAEPMRMHSVRSTCGMVAEVDLYHVPDCGTDNRAQDPQPPRLGYAGGKVRVGVLDVPGHGKGMTVSPRCRNGAG